jgi:hypothetical protein
MPRNYSQRPTTVINRERRKTFHTYFRSNIYDKIKERCRRGKYWVGLPYMNKTEWFRFLDETFIERVILFNNWKQSLEKRSLAPSIDRINSNFGYLPDNVRWVTMAENSRHQIPWTAKKTTCKNGHPFDKITSKGFRRCTPCHKAMKHRYYIEVEKPKRTVQEVV